MARNFRRQRQSAPISELNVTNLIDLGFTLMIVFMITTPLINQEQTIPVDLPVQSRTQQSKPDPDTRFIAITIKADGTVTVGTEVVALAQLTAALASYAGDPNPPVFRIRTDADAKSQYMVTVLDAMQSNGLNKFSIDTQVVGQ